MDSEQNNLPHSRGRQQSGAASTGHKVQAPQVQWILLAKKKVKGTYITYCRFGFPRAACESATLKTMEECVKGSQRQVYKLPRSPEEIRINHYNPLLLMLWKANMDIQFIAESTLAIAQYVTGYVTKAATCKTFGRRSPLTSRSLWSFGVRSLRSRECGLYEASDLLLGDHLCGKSQTIKWVDVSQPHNRKHRLRDHSKLVEIQQRNPNSTNIFEENLVDTFYPKRPGGRVPLRLCCQLCQVRD